MGNLMSEAKIDEFPCIFPASREFPGFPRRVRSRLPPPAVSRQTIGSSAAEPHLPRSPASHNLLKPRPSPARWNGSPSRRNRGEPQCRLRRRLPFAATSGGPTTKLAVALRGRRLERVVTPSDWVHTILAALAHDIGYVRGVCPGDTGEHFVIDAAGNTVTPPRGASDAFLTPYHVERGK